MLRRENGVLLLASFAEIRTWLSLGRLFYSGQSMSRTLVQKPLHPVKYRFTWHFTAHYRAFIMPILCLYRTFVLEFLTPQFLQDPTLFAGSQNELRMEKLAHASSKN